MKKDSIPLQDYSLDVQNNGGLNSDVLATRDSMTSEEFSAILLEGLKQAKANKSLPMEEAFNLLREGL